MPRTAPPSPILRAAAIVAVAFGLLTVVSGGAVLFGGDQAQAAAGAYVPFVVWFNFLSGFVYVAAGAGLHGGRRWAAQLSVLLAAALLAVAAAFALHVAGGGAYEPRTVAALALRALVWIVIAALACPRLACWRTRTTA